MKLKGTWIALCLILAVGIFSTDYVKRQTEDGIATAAETTSSEAKGNPEQKAQILQEESVSSADQDLSAAAIEGPSLIQDDEAQENSALFRLQELDEQIAKNRAKETEVTANSRKASAESERKLWESEMQHMLNILKDRLDPSQQDELMLRQKEWMKDRESQAIAASGKQAGGAMEELNYSMALTEITRMRAYELAEDYSIFLAE